MKNSMHFLKLALLAASILVLSSCGGGGGGSTTPATGTLSGVAAVGTPIVGGTIHVICAAGSALTTTTDSTGAWQLTLSGQTLPCAVEISGGTINSVANPTSYYSIALATGTVNVTPLTDLLVANLVGTANLGTWFAGLSTNPAPLAAITQAQVNTALANLSAALPALTPLGTTNPITTTFTPTSGNVSDDMLTALATAMTNSGVTFDTLLVDASAASFTAPAAGFGAALAAAYATTVSGIPTLVGTNTAGQSKYSLYLQESTGIWSSTGGYSFSNVTNSLIDYSGLGTTATVPYSANSGSTFYNLLTADRSGNLWAVQNTVAPVGGWQISTAIVKYPNASSNPTSLTPTTVITLPSNISVHFMTFDSSGNLWLDGVDVSGTGAAEIVEYTAASAYATTGTVISYSGNGGWSGGCQGASLAFSFDGHLVANESYANGSGNCINQIAEYLPDGTSVTSKYFPSGYSGNWGQLVIDASNNLWVFSQPDCSSGPGSGCTTPGHIYEVSSAGSVLQTLPLPSNLVQGYDRSPVFDANGNLWFAGASASSHYCSGTWTNYIYELPSGTANPIVASSSTQSCPTSSTPFNYFWGLAITPSAASVIIPTVEGTNTSGESQYSLYFLESSGIFTLDGSAIFSNVTSSLLDYSGMGTTATVPYSEASGSMFYNSLTADSTGNLWAVQNNGATTGQGWQASTAIVKYPNASGNPSSLTPTFIVTLPSNIAVDHIAFDSSGNLWLDEIDLNDSAANIVEYTAASSYATIGTIIPYGVTGGTAGNCEGASLAFGFDGHLVALENGYSSSVGDCSNEFAEYTPAGAPVTSKYYPGGYSGNYGDLAIDASGNLWVFSQPDDCATNVPNPGCSIPGYIYEVSSTGTPLQTIPLSPSTSNRETAGNPVFDANGNLWFTGSSTKNKWCSDTSTGYLYELPSGATTPIVAYSNTQSCPTSNTPTIFFTGMAITPVAPNLPQ